MISVTLHVQMHTCHDPYGDRMNKNTIWNAILEGPPARPRDSFYSCEPRRLISEPIWELLLECWKGVVDQRPTVNSIVRRLESGDLFVQLEAGSGTRSLKY
jgi:hypothetical protein